MFLWHPQKISAITHDSDSLAWYVLLSFRQEHAGYNINTNNKPYKQSHARKHVFLFQSHRSTVIQMLDRNNPTNKHHTFQHICSGAKLSFFLQDRRSVAADPYPDIIHLPPFSPLTLTNRTLQPHRTTNPRADPLGFKKKNARAGNLPST